jgi:hypothetical protein
MDFFDILLAKKLEDDRDPKVEGLSVTANGTYSEDGVVYKPVVVNVPETPLSSLAVTANGTYTAPTGTGYNEVDVNVPLPENAYLLEEYEDVPTDIASFTASDAPLKSLTASIVPVQAGSGDPSPTNVRPISGWTDCEVTVADDTTTPTVEQTYTIPFTDSQGQSVTIYGGTLDVINGTSGNEKTYGFVDLGTLSWSYNDGIFSADLPLMKLKGSLMCSQYVQTRTTPIQDWKIWNESWAYSPNNILIVDSRYTSASDFKTAMNGVQLRYELATPTTFYTQPTSIKSLDGENNVSASTGQIENLEFFTKGTS